MKEQTKIYKAPIVDRRKYRGMQVAIINNKVVAAGRDALGVLKKAHEKYPKKRIEEIGLMSVPKEDLMILFF